MKKILLLCTAIAISIGAVAQVKEAYPNGFRKAEVPAALKKYSGEVLVPIKKNQAVDNGIPFNNVNQSPLRVAPSSPVYFYGDSTETIGNSKYDLQTNNAISSRLIWNNDGSISACWTFSPDISTGYPYRGTGYNYWDGTSYDMNNYKAWLTPYPPGTTQRTETSRTGFPNIVITPSGHEMTISHQAVPNATFNRIVVNWRPVKGTGAWTLTNPWGPTGRFDTWTKACSGLTNENVYVIWNASGAPATTTDPPNIVNGQNGALAFARSTDGGVSWDSVRYIPEIDSNYYYGFGGDSYSIDARGDTVAIAAGDQYTDVVLLKSFDAGLHWTKTIVQKFFRPLYYKLWLDSGTYYIGNDNIPDTVFSNGGDPKVIIDNDGMCHVFFSAFNFRDSIIGDGFYNPNTGTDNLYYWNELMGEDTTTVWNPFGGNGNYIAIAAAEDFNGNGIIDTPVDTFTTCDPGDPWGNYQGGITQMPSCGIDENGNIYIAYQTINEAADTSITADHKCHRHIYTMMHNAPFTLANSGDWTHPFNIVPMQAQGGNGEFEECVFGCMARRVDWASKTAYVLYQRDPHPGHSLATAGTCDADKNAGVNNEMILAKVDINSLIIVNVNELSQNDVFVGQNYPNPATGTTSINIGLKKSANLKIEISDLIGKVVYRESKGKVVSGNHTFTLNTSKMGKGVYMYTVTAGDISTTRKMIVE